MTGSDGNVFASLKQTLPCEPPEQLFPTSDKILHISTLAHFLHLSKQDWCVHLDAGEHTRTGGMINVPRAGYQQIPMSHREVHFFALFTGKAEMLAGSFCHWICKQLPNDHVSGWLGHLYHSLNVAYFILPLKHLV